LKDAKQVGWSSNKSALLLNLNTWKYFPCQIDIPWSFTDL
jgi:hypothetical protein